MNTTKAIQIFIQLVNLSILMDKLTNVLYASHTESGTDAEAKYLADADGWGFSKRYNWPQQAHWKDVIYPYFDKDGNDLATGIPQKLADGSTLRITRKNGIRNDDGARVDFEITKNGKRTVTSKWELIIDHMESRAKQAEFCISYKHTLNRRYLRLRNKLVNAFITGKIDKMPNGADAAEYSGNDLYKDYTIIHKDYKAPNRLIIENVGRTLNSFRAFFATLDKLRNGSETKEVCATYGTTRSEYLLRAFPSDATVIIGGKVQTDVISLILDKKNDAGEFEPLYAKDCLYSDLLLAFRNSNEFYGNNAEIKFARERGFPIAVNQMLFHCVMDTQQRQLIERTKEIKRQTAASLHITGKGIDGMEFIDASFLDEYPDMKSLLFRANTDRGATLTSYSDIQAVASFLRRHAEHIASINANFYSHRRYENCVVEAVYIKDGQLQDMACQDAPSQELLDEMADDKLVYKAYCMKDISDELTAADYLDADTARYWEIFRKVGNAQIAEIYHAAEKLPESDRDAYVATEIRKLRVEEAPEAPETLDTPNSPVSESKPAISPESFDGQDADDIQEIDDLPELPATRTQIDFAAGFTASFFGDE